MKKVIAAISALVLTGSITVVNASALSFDDLYAWVRNEEITTDETTETEEAEDTGITTITIVTTTEETESETTTTITTSTEEETELSTTTDEEKEQLKKQIEELERQLEERGMTIDDLSCTIDELQYALTQANNRASSGGSSGGGSGGGGVAKAPVVTTVTEVTTVETTTVTADTDGNAELVEAVKKEDTERQFITVSAKDGSVFYIIIDHEGENENVYFLNKVDVADLNAILDPDGKNTVTEIVTAPVVTEATPTVTEPVEEETNSLSKISGFLPLLGIGAFAAIYYFFKIRPKKNAIPDDYDSDDDGEDFEQEEEYIDEDGSNE